MPGFEQDLLALDVDAIPIQFEQLTFAASGIESETDEAGKPELYALVSAVQGALKK